MNRRTGNTLALMTAAPLLFGCSGEAHPSATQQDPYTLSVAQQDHIQQTFDRDVSYWKQRGVGAIAQARLVILGSKTDQFECPTADEKVTTTYTYHGLSSVFCPTKNTIIIVGGTIRAQLAIGGKQPGADSLVNHEVGHAVQYAKHELDIEALADPAKTAPIELQATCYAGNVSHEYDTPAIIEAMRKNFAETPMDGAHGTSEQQAASFMLGAHGGDCETILTPRA